MRQDLRNSGLIRIGDDLARPGEDETETPRSDTLFLQKIRKVHRGEICSKHTRHSAAERAAQRETRLAVHHKDVEIAQLHTIAMHGGTIPRPLSRVESRWNGVGVSNLHTLIVEKHPVLYPCTVIADGHDPVGEGSVLRRSKETAKAHPRLAGDVIHGKKFTVVETNIQGEDLRIEAEHPQQHRAAYATVVGQQ